jgi:peptidoglycan hydrolase-like protein with peptidoglycan-binding domain
MKKLIVRAAILAIFTAGISGVTGIATAGTAMACESHGQRSDQLADSLPQVTYGQSGKHVLALQLALHNEGYHLQGTGKYAQNTLAAVKDFQRKNGINDSGIVGSKTWHALVGKLSPSVTGNGGATPAGFSITPGERNQDKMDTLFNVVQRIYPYVGHGLPNEGAVYGPRTQALVKDFQKRAGIKASGIIGPKTWSAMFEAVSVSGGWGC